MIKDGCTGGFGSRTSGGRNAKQRLENLVDGGTTTDGSVDEFEQIGVRVAAEKVGDFARIHYRSTTHRQKVGEVLFTCKLDRFLPTLLIRLHPNLVKDLVLNPSLLKPSILCFIAVSSSPLDRKNTHLPRLHIGKVHTDFLGDTFTVPNVGSGKFKGVFAFDGVIDRGGVSACVGTRLSMCLAIMFIPARARLAPPRATEHP